MAPILNLLYALMPGLRVQPDWMAWAVLALANLLGTLAWMLAGSLSRHLVQAWRDNSRAG